MNREEKKRAKREEIVKNSLKLFNEKGYDNTTTAEIAASCHIAKKTLFQYFPSKEDIIFGDERELLTEILNLLANTSNPWEEYLAWLSNFNREPEDEFALPAIIRKNPALHNRLLQMWNMYEMEISEQLGNSISNQILAAKIVLPLRLMFDQNLEISEIIKALS